MTLENHRVERLREWLGEFDGKISAFCRMYGLPRTRASYLSQILSGNRPLGERAARKLEEECGRPQGWLDLNMAKPAGLSYDVARVSQLGSAERALIEGFIDFVLRRSEASQHDVKLAPLNMRIEIEPHPEQVKAIKIAANRPKRAAKNVTHKVTKRHAA